MVITVQGFAELAYFTLGRSIWLCIVSIIMQLGWGRHHIGLGFRLRNGKLDTGLKHIAYVIEVKSFFSGFFPSIKKKKPLKELHILYMENKHEDTGGLTVCIPFTTAHSGNARPCALILRI